jgi:hypothetical protein
MGFVSFVSDTVGEVFRKLSLLVRQQSLLQTDATDATDAIVTNTAGEFDFFSLHHAYLCSKSRSEH